MDIIKLDVACFIRLLEQGNDAELERIRKLSGMNNNG